MLVYNTIRITVECVKDYQLAINEVIIACHNNGTDFRVKRNEQEMVYTG